MMPKRYLYVLVAFVLIVVALLSHPASREQLRQAKDYSVATVSSLTKGAQEQWHSVTGDKQDDTSIDILLSTASPSMATTIPLATPSSDSKQDDTPIDILLPTASPYEHSLPASMEPSSSAPQASSTLASTAPIETSKPLEEWQEYENYEEAYAQAHQHSSPDAPSTLSTSTVQAHSNATSVSASPTAEITSVIASSVQTQEPTTTQEVDDSAATPDDLWHGPKWFFEGDNELYPNPIMDVQNLKKYAPHNYNGPGHKTVAIFLATRNASMQDSYFLAAQQQVYRILWDPKTKSKYPLTVFVAPFVKRQQRDFLAAAGAYVREITLVPWIPLYELDSSPRWKDQFTKLNLWDQSDYSKILYLDTDAFPIRPFDELIDSVTEPHLCRKDLIPEVDRVNVDDMCQFTFTATRDARGDLNAGMFVLEPNKAMHELLIRGMFRDREHYNNNIVEQGYLEYVFREDGPFPGQYVDRKWNRIESQADEENDTIILHEKLWIFYFMPDHWALHYFNDTWMDMLELYQSPRFQEIRALDGPALA